MPPHTHVAIPGLLSLLEEEQRAVLTALAGLDGAGPRTLEEAAALLETDAALLAFHVATTARTLVRGVTTPPPGALRLLAVFPAENVAVWHDQVLTAERIALTFYAARFPARLHLNLCALWSGGNPGQSYHTGARILDPEGVELDRAAGELAGGAAQINQVLLLEPVSTRPGLHTIEVWLDTAPLFALPLYLNPEAQPAPPGEGPAPVSLDKNP